LLGLNISDKQREAEREAEDINQPGAREAQRMAAEAKQKLELMSHPTPEAGEDKNCSWAESSGNSRMCAHVQLMLPNTQGS